MKDVLLVALLMLACPPLSAQPKIATMVVPHAQPGQSFSFQMQGTCQDQPCNWQAFGLPKGYSISSAGQITGVSAALIGSQAFTVRLTDRNGQSAEVPYYFSNSPDRTVQWPNTVKTAGFPYVDDYPEIWVPQANDWLRRTFDIIIGGTPNLALGEKYPAYMQGLIDSAGTRPGLINRFVVDLAAKRGWANYENYFLHAKNDYYAAPNAGRPTDWAHMDMFDIFDMKLLDANMGIANPVYVTNGVLLHHGGSYEDISVGVYEQRGPYKLSNGDDLYIGYAEPFALINVTLSTGRDGGSASYEYWNGSDWAPLDTSADTTNGLKSSGAVNFIPPAKWTKNSVNNSRPKWWVRIVVKGTHSAPQIAKLWGDDWESHASGCSPKCNVRGWDPSDQHRVNVGQGNLEYNPTPPDKATAHFRYQGRVTGWWSSDFMYNNPNSVDPKTGDNMAAWTLTALDVETVSGYRVLGENHNGSFFDDVGGVASQWNSSNSDLAPGTTFDTGVPGMISSLRTLLHSALGDNFAMLANVGCPDPCRSAVKAKTEFSLNERIGYVSQLGYYHYAKNWMDIYATGHHVNIVNFWDNTFQASYDPCMAQGKGHCATYQPWPRNDRGPMQALGGYLIGMNPNTAFEYDVTGWEYPHVDEVYVSGPVTTKLAEAVSADPGNVPQMIHVEDGSSFKPTRVFGYILQIGDEVILAKEGPDHNHFQFNTDYGANYLTRDYPAGTPVKSAVIKHLSTDGVPHYQDVLFWTMWYPALAADFGQPDPQGWNHGARGEWLTGDKVGVSRVCATTRKCPGVERRDFTKAIVLQRAMGDHDRCGVGDTLIADRPAGVPGLRLEATPCRWLARCAGYNGFADGKRDGHLHEGGEFKRAGKRAGEEMTSRKGSSSARLKASYQRDVDAARCVPFTSGRKPTNNDRWSALADMTTATDTHRCPAGSGRRAVWD